MTEGKGPLPKASIERFLPVPEGEDQYPIEYCESNRVLKLAEDAAGVVVGICEPADKGLMRGLEAFHRKPVSFRALDPAELAGYLGRRLAGGENPDKGAGQRDETITLDKLANDAPIVNFVNSLCIEAIRAGASDIHIESFTREAVVRYRIDGVLSTVQKFEAERFAAVATRVKIMANLNIMERRLPQDGRITVDIGHESVDLRVSIVPIARGESIVLRLFAKSGSPLELEQLGFGGDDLAAIQRLLRIPHGLILVTGPTGSGKTTTLNAMLRRVRSDALKIISIEDPIEYVMDGIAQIQTNEQIKLGFDSILRRVLRQDPDVVMVGEIRDAQTADLVVRAALTGHLVLSTLHTNDSVSVISRLRNIGIEPYLVASVLRGALAQRLARRLCKACRRPRKPSASELELFARYHVPVETLWEPVGCEACRRTGYSGRVAVVERYENDEGLEGMIVRGERASAMLDYLRGRGMRTLPEDGLAKAASGETSLEEVAREVEL